MTNEKWKRPVTTLIVGAGAVENAWNPVLRALQSYFDFPLTADGANCFLARAVYLLRWWSSSPGEMAEQQLSLHKTFFDKLKKDICAEIQASQERGELKRGIWGWPACFIAVRTTCSQTQTLTSAVKQRRITDCRVFGKSQFIRSQ